MEWVWAVIAICGTFIVAGGGIMWRQGKSEGSIKTDIKYLATGLAEYRKENEADHREIKNDVEGWGKVVGEQGAEIAQLQGYRNGRERGGRNVQT